MRRQFKFDDGVVDISDLERFDITEDERLQIEDLGGKTFGGFPDPITKDDFGLGLSWDSVEFVAWFKKYDKSLQKPRGLHVGKMAARWAKVQKHINEFGGITVLEAAQLLCIGFGSAAYSLQVYHNDGLLDVTDVKVNWSKRPVNRFTAPAENKVVA